MGTFNVPLLILFLGVICQVRSYTKYGRSCKDIGCLPSEQCVISIDSCSYSQREGKECGNYPTCKKKDGVASLTPGASLNPAPDNTRVSNPSLNSADRQNSQPQPIDPNYVFGQPQNAPVFNPSLPIFPASNPNPSYNQYPNYHNQHNQYQPPQYPQIPQPQPPQTNPYANNPQSPYPNPPNVHQAPYAFGNPPPGVFWHTTTKEPSLLHQFLYNKQQQKPRNAAATLSHSPLTSFVTTAIAIFVAAYQTRWSLVMA